jgi:hypothetical protein
VQFHLIITQVPKRTHADFKVQARQQEKQAKEQRKQEDKIKESRLRSHIRQAIALPKVPRPDQMVGVCCFRQVVTDIFVNHFMRDL